MSEAPSRPWVAVALCASGVAMFSLMDVLMKSTSLSMGVYSAIVWRSVVGSLFSGTLYAAKGARRPPALVMRLHIYRALLIGPMIWLFFWAFTRLPLAEAIALSFVAPIIALGLIPLMLGEHVGRHSIIAALVGIIGVVVILAGRMGGNYHSGALLGAGAAILSAVFYAVNLVLQRQPLMYRYDRDELSRFLALADTLQSQARDLPGAKEALHALANSVESGEDVLDRARAEPSELEMANFDLREKIGALITAIYAGTETGKLKHISDIVTAHAKEQLLRERSWLIGQGWEADPKSIPAIETLIGEGPGAR